MTYRARQFRVRPWKQALTPWFAFVGACLAAAVIAVRFKLSGSLVASFALLAMALVVALATLVPATATVGVDGVRLQWLFARKFVAFSNVEHVTLLPLTTSGRSGYQVAIETELGDDVHLDCSEAKELFETIHEIRRRLHVARKASVDTHPLDVADGEPRAWLARLREIAGRVHDYRVEVPSREELLTLLEDPRAREESRAAAAVVLASAPEEPVRKRLRVVRDATASPQLQRAIDAAIEGEEEAIERALEELRARR